VRYASSISLKSWLRLFAPALALSAVLLLLIVAPTTSTHAQVLAPEDGKPVIRFVRNPEPAPGILTHDLSGTVVSSASWQGKVTLVTFWATWCGPCRREIPELINLQKQYAGELQIIGISVDDDPPERVKAFADNAGINYPVIMATPEIVRNYGGVPALPTTFVLSKDTGVVAKHVGLYPASVFDREIRALLGKPVDATVETVADTGQVFLKNAANATEFPGVSLAGLTPAQRAVVLKRLNSEDCNCGCGLTLAQCRINDSSCDTSLKLARDVVRVAAGKSAPVDESAPALSNTKTQSKN
jgi:thiol-disulfide isomerase/thioredoxin